MPSRCLWQSVHSRLPVIPIGFVKDGQVLS
jgi:hypothetical protein